MRSEDAFSPDSRHDMRPDYPSIVYTQILKKLYPDVPVALGGIEASLRRISHYDYWKDELRKCILCDQVPTSSSMVWANALSWNLPMH